MKNMKTLTKLSIGARSLFLSLNLVLIGTYLFYRVPVL